MRTAARQTLDDFVRRTLEIVTQGEMQYSELEEHSFTQYARVDIGLIRDREDQLHWFVNDIERGFDASVWCGVQSDLALRMMDDAVEAIMNWLHHWAVRPSREIVQAAQD